MEEERTQLNPETLSCPICLDQLGDPVVIPCGHSYCQVCIEGHWDREAEKNVYSCPQCRETFRPRPEREVEELKKTRLQAAPADHCCSGAEDVACDVCTGRKLRAEKSCLVCLASYCEEHLQPHHLSTPLQEHKLVETSKNLQENICSIHDEVRNVFCLTDQQSLCSVDQHKGHDTVSAAAEWTQRQREVELSLQEIQQSVQDREKDLKELLQQGETVNVTADEAVEDSEKIFAELVRPMEKRSSEVKQQIRSQQDREVCGVRDAEEKLQQEITELKRKETELKKLSQTPSLSALRPSPPSSSINVPPQRLFEEVKEDVAKIRCGLQDRLTNTRTEISKALRPEPQTRAEFLQYSQEISLDPNIVNRRLLLSEGNRKVTAVEEVQYYSSHPERFTDCPQVLSKESMTGQCYWEVEWRGKGGGGQFSVAVTYKSIKRRGGYGECWFGFNNKSWSLFCKNNSWHFYHDSIGTKVPVPESSSRLGVYLDHSAGLLSFYSVSDTMTLLLRVQTKFTQPLYAGLGFYLYPYRPGYAAEFCKL